MELKVDISMNNSAFNEAGNGTEAARILRVLADRIDGIDLQEDCGTINDSNGNKVCCWTADD